MERKKGNASCWENVVLRRERNLTHDSKERGAMSFPILAASRPDKWLQKKEREEGKLPGERMTNYLRQETPSSYSDGGSVRRKGAFFFVGKELGPPFGPQGERGGGGSSHAKAEGGVGPHLTRGGKAGRILPRKKHYAYLLGPSKGRRGAIRCVCTGREQVPPH